MVFSIFKQEKATLKTSGPTEAFLPHIIVGQFYCSKAVDNRTCLVKQFSYMKISITKSVFSLQNINLISIIIGKIESES